MIRLDYLDISKAICILSVVIGHCVDGYAHWILYSFHIPMFFIISGFCFKIDNNKLFLPFLLKRSRSLLLPLIIWTAIAFLLTHTVFPGYYTLDKAKQALLPSALWFLLSLFLTEIIYYPIKKKKTKIIAISMALIMSVILQDLNIHLPFHIENIFICLFFYGVGDVFFKKFLYNHSKLDLCRQNNVIVPLSFIFMVLLVCYSKDSFDIYRNHIPQPSMVWIAIAISLSYSLFIISRFIERFYGLKFVIMLRHIGRNTMTILCTHILFIEIFNRYLCFYLTNRIIQILSELGLIMGGAFLLIPLFNKYCPIVIGRKKK